VRVHELGSEEDEEEYDEVEPVYEGVQRSDEEEDDETERDL
jgi:hypothetical protein